jgi:hypothetical protein
MRRAAQGGEQRNTDAEHKRTLETFRKHRIHTFCREGEIENKGWRTSAGRQHPVPIKCLGLLGVATYSAHALLSSHNPYYPHYPPSCEFRKQFSFRLFILFSGFSQSSAPTQA